MNENPSLNINSLQIKTFGQVPYEPIWRAMQSYTTERDANSPDQLWVLEHPPILTLGQAGKKEHVIIPSDIEVLQVDRGGQVTYHGPGQLVIYLLVDLRRKNIGIRELVSSIENSLIALLKDYGLDAKNNPTAPGVYINGAKICALGLRVKRGCSYHGLSFNIDMDLSPFQTINPCGYQNLAVTQLSDFVPGIKLKTIADKLCKILADTLHYDSFVYLDDVKEPL